MALIESRISCRRAGRRPSERRGRSPAPIPRMVRPGASSSKVAAFTATMPGWRVWGLVTAVPRINRVVRRPARARCT